MGALSGSTRPNFELAVKKFSRHLSVQIMDGIYTESELIERLTDALMRAARRGAEHPEWFAGQPADSELVGY